MNPHLISRLAKLSLFRTGRGRKVPHVPTNPERLALFRLARFPELGNNFAWKWRA